MSSSSDPECNMQSTLPLEALASRNLQDRGKVEAALTSDWETGLDLKERDDASCGHRRVEEQQVETGPPPEDGNNSIRTALQEMVVNEVKRQVQMAFLAIQDIIRHVIEELLRAARTSGKGEPVPWFKTLWNKLFSVICRWS